MGQRYTGKIVRLTQDKGFGFLNSDATGEDYFFHRSSLDGCVFEALKEKQVVSFELGQSPKGPRAENVRVVTGNN